MHEIIKDIIYIALKANANCILQGKGETSAAAAAVHLLISLQGFVFMTRVKTKYCSKSNTSRTQFYCFVQSHSNTWHICTSITMTLELVGQKSLSSTKGGLFQALQAFLNLCTFNCPAVSHSQCISCCFNPVLFCNQGYI